MLAQLIINRPFAARAIGALGIAVAAAAFAPISLASADDEPLPGAPVVRDSKPSIVSAGPSEVRAVARQAPLGGVQANNNGGGLVKDGNAHTPDAVRGGASCSKIPNIPATFRDGKGYESVVKC